MAFDSFVNNGPRIANIKTYRAENGFKIGINPPAIPKLAMMIENSPRETIVNPIFNEPL